MTPTAKFFAVGVLLYQTSLELPSDTQAHQTARGLSEQIETELMKAGFDSGDLYQQSRADQLKLIDQVMDDVLTDEAMGDLSALVEGEQNQISANAKMGLEKADGLGKIEVDTSKEFRFSGYQRPSDKKKFTEMLNKAICLLEQKNRGKYIIINDIRVP